MVDVIEDEQILSRDVQVAKAKWQQSMAARLDDLPECETLILRLRFGLETEYPPIQENWQENWGAFGSESRSVDRLRQSDPGALLMDQIDEPVDE